MIVKRLIIFICCVLSVAMPTLASCTAPTIPDEAEAPDSGAKALNVWTWRGNYNGRALEIAHEHFARDNPGLAINVINVNRDEILSQLKVKFTIKDYTGLPDIVLIEDYHIQEILRKFPGEIRAMPASLDKNIFAEFAVKAESLNGNIYGVPLDSGAAVMFYRVDYIESAGYTPEDMENLTWEKYIEIGKAVKEKTSKHMLTLTPTDLWQIRLMLQSVGQWYVKEDGITVDIADNPALKDAIRAYIDIVESGIALHVSGYDKEYGAVWEGGVATVLTGTWRLETMLSTTSTQGSKWAIAPIPRMSSHGSVNASALGGYGWYVIDKAENADTAVDFLLSTLVFDMDAVRDIAKELSLVSSLKAAGDIPEYSSPIKEFYGQPSLKTLVEMAKGVPAVDYGMHTYAIDRLIEHAVQLIMQGADIDDTLRNAQINAEAIP